ncbi:MAG: hypothetical protein AAFQ94_21640 [Bacteroidota bacterium]
MRISLIETQEIDRYLNDEMTTMSRLVFESRMLVDPLLKEKVEHQKKANELIKVYGRQKLKQEIRNIDQMLFSDAKFKSFQTKVFTIFNSK